jgi:acyl carrier protein
MSGLDHEAVLHVVVGIVARVTNRPQPATAMETMLFELDGLDSLRLLETVALAEEHFGVQVDTGGLGQIETVGDIVRLVASGRRG